MTVAVAGALLDRLYRKAEAVRWDVSREQFAEALEVSAARAAGIEPASIERYLETLHVADLALACACAAGHEGAWDHVMHELRPVLSRAAQAIGAGGGAGDLADGIYAELFGLDERGRQRPSLFRYYHGRSSLATWARAVLAQRHVDRLRAARRLEPLPEVEPEAPGPVPSEFERPRWLRLVSDALARAIGRLESRDRLRLAAYYADGATLAEIGKMIGEHEATVSRHLSRLRKTLRADIERELEADGLSQAEIAQCVSSVSRDAGPIDLGQLLDAQDHGGRNVQGMRGGL